MVSRLLLLLMTAARLPAVAPDGLPLDAPARPWLLLQTWVAEGDATALSALDEDHTGEPAWAVSRLIMAERRLAEGDPAGTEKALQAVAPLNLPAPLREYARMLAVRQCLALGQGQSAREQFQALHATSWPCHDAILAAELAEADPAQSLDLWRRLPAQLPLRAVPGETPLERWVHAAESELFARRAVDWPTQRQLGLGEAFIASGRPLEARLAFALAGDSCRARTGLLHTQTALGELECAASTAAELLQECSGPEALAAADALARVYLLRGFADRAARLWLQLREGQPAHPSAIAWRLSEADACLRMGNLERADSLLRSAVPPRWATIRAILRARARLLAGDAMSASAILGAEPAPIEDPERSRYLLARAEVALARADLRAAEELLRGATAPAARLLLGDLLAGSGRAEEALALIAQGEAPEVSLRRAQWLETLGRYADAEGELRSALAEPLNLTRLPTRAALWQKLAALVFPAKRNDVLNAALAELAAIRDAPGVLKLLRQAEPPTESSNPTLAARHWVVSIEDGPWSDAPSWQVHAPHLGADGLLLLAQKALDAGDCTAVETIAGHVESLPPCASTRWIQAEVKLLQGNANEALTLASWTRAEAPDALLRAYAGWVEVRAHASLGQWKQVRKRARELVSNASLPLSLQPRVLLLLGRADERLSEPAAALLAYQRVLNLYRNSGDAWTDAQASAVRLLKATGRHADAARLRAEEGPDGT